MFDLAAALSTREFWCVHLGWRLSDRQLERVFGVDRNAIEERRFASSLGPDWYTRLFNVERREGQSYLRAVERANGDREAAWESVARRSIGPPIPASQLARLRQRFDDADRLASLPNVAYVIRYSGGYSIRVEYVPEPGICYSLCRDAHQPILLGFDSPQFQQPSLRFTELELLARRAIDVEPVGREWAGRLLAPCAWPTAEDKKSGRALLNMLWPAGGIPAADRVKLLVDALLRPVTPVVWTEDSQLGYLCSGEFARRAERGVGHATLERDELIAVRDFFDALR